MLNLDGILGRVEDGFTDAIAEVARRFPESTVRLALDPERLVALARAIRDLSPEKFAEDKAK